MKLRLAVTVVGICILAAGCGGSTQQSSSRTTTTATTATTTTTVPPVATAALEGLLLNPDQINAAIGASGMSVQGQTSNGMTDAAKVVPQNCAVMAAETDQDVYTGSGWMAVRGQLLQDSPDASVMKFQAAQAVVLFPSAQKASDFFTTSSQHWPMCSNQQYTSEQGNTWAVGPVSNTDGVLSVFRIQQNIDGWNCQRALTVRNNVAIDVVSCSFTANLPAAVNIARQIATKVPNT